MLLKYTYSKFSENSEMGHGESTNPCRIELNGFTLIAQSKFELTRWQEVLKSLTIQTNFHSKFKPIKLLGEGSFAKVQIPSLILFINPQK